MCLHFHFTWLFCLGLYENIGVRGSLLIVLFMLVVHKFFFGLIFRPTSKYFRPAPLSLLVAMRYSVQVIHMLSTYL